MTSWAFVLDLLSATRYRSAAAPGVRLEAKTQRRCVPNASTHAPRRRDETPLPNVGLGCTPSGHSCIGSRLIAKTDAAPELTRFSPRRGVTALVLDGPNRGARSCPPLIAPPTRETDDRLAGGPVAVAPGNYFR